MRTFRTLLPAIAVATLVAAAPASAGLTLVEGSPTTTPSSDEDYAQAECPGGTEVTGGGAFSTGFFSQVAIVTSYPEANDTWTEYTDVYTGPQDHTAYAICDTGAVAVKKESRKLSTDKTGTVRASCPAGKNLYGGGFYTDAVYGESDAMVSAPAGDGWRAKLHNFSVVKIKIIAYALCGSKASRVVSNSKQLDANAQGYVAAQCPGNDLVTGGGAAIASKSSSTWLSTIYPSGDDRFRAYAENATGNKHKLTAYAICR